MMNPAITPITPADPTPSIWPSHLLASGYVRVCVGGVEEWVFLHARQSLDDLRDIVGLETVGLSSTLDGTTLTYLADTFDKFLHLSAGLWEVDLQRTVHPATLLRLWETAAGVYRHFTSGKKLTPGAKLDYLRIILCFFNQGPVACLQGLSLQCLSAARAKRVVTQMDRYFHHHRARGRYRS